jgi:hypothetical protein
MLRQSDAGAAFIAKVPTGVRHRHGDRIPVSFDADRFDLFDPQTGQALQ